MAERLQENGSVLILGDGKVEPRTPFSGLAGLGRKALRVEDCEHGYRAAGGTYGCPVCEVEEKRER